MRIYLILTVFISLVLCSLSRSSNMDPYRVQVLAKSGIFSFSGADKIAIDESGLTHEGIFAFLDSAGAVSIRKIFPHFSQADTLCINYEGDIVKLIDLSKYYIIEFADSADWHQLRDCWKGTDSLRILGQDFFDDICRIKPNDPWFKDQWHLTSRPDTIRYYENSANFDSAWVFTNGNENVLVGIIDGGFDTSHVELSGRVIGGINLTTGSDPSDISDDQSSEGGNPGNHGTPVAGVISANTNNELGVAGIDWLIRLFV